MIAGGSFVFFLLGEKEGIAKGRLEGGNSYIKGFDNFSQSTPQDTLYWMEVTSPYMRIGGAGQSTEYQKVFGTNDVSHAQQHVPFTVVLPTYLPPSNQHLPAIQGRLDPTDNSTFEIRITYGVLPKGIIIITENRFQRTTANPTPDPTLERIVISGKQVLKSKDNTLFTFDSGDIQFSIQSHDVPGEDVYKVAESMIRQVK